MCQPNISKDPCGCPSTPLCGCKSKIDAKCVIYDAQYLDPVCILQGDNMEEIVKKINDFLKSMAYDIENAFVAQNVGGKIQIYKGQSANDIEEFRTLDGVEGIEVVQDLDVIKIKIDTEWLTDHFPTISLSNVGIGTPLTRTSGVNQYAVKKVRSAQGTVLITEDPTGSVNFEVDSSLLSVFKDIGSDGTGTDIYNGVSNGRAGISTLKSDTLDIKKSPDGTITINSIEKGFGYVKAFYVNSNYIPTTDSPSDGSIIRPFTNFDEAKIAVIGNGTILHPQNQGARVILQTSSYTTTNPTVNTMVIELQDTNLTYTGTDLYMFDTEILYPLVPKDSNNEITSSIHFSIVGRGSLYRNNGIGIIRSIGAKRGGSTTTNNGNIIQVNVGEKSTDVISINERIDYPDSVWEGHQMRPNGVKVGDSYNPPSDLRWTTQLNPTTPIIQTIGTSFATFSFSMAGAGTLFIATMINTALHVEDTLVRWDKLYIDSNGSRIVVQDGLLNDPIYPDVYKPKPYPAIYAKNANFYIEEIYHPNGGTFAHYGWDTFLKIVGTFSLNGKFNYNTNYYIGTFIDATESTYNYFATNQKTGGAKIHSRIRNFIAPNDSKPYELHIPNTVITGVHNINKLTNVTINVYTSGTLSSINSIPYLTGAPEYADDTVARANGLLQGALYINANQNLTTL